MNRETTFHARKHKDMTHPEFACFCHRRAAGTPSCVGGGCRRKSGDAWLSPASSSHLTGSEAASNTSKSCRTKFRDDSYTKPEHSVGAFELLEAELVEIVGGSQHQPQDSVVSCGNISFGYCC